MREKGGDKMDKLIPIERIESKIYLIRSQKVMIDSDLAQLYGIRTKNLNKAISRNPGRFPEDFMFQLSVQEHENLRFQIGTSKRGGRRYLPYAFTEQGVAMLSSVLNSERAILVNIAIMRAFVKLKQVLATHKEVSRKLKKLEDRVDQHDSEIRAIFEAIRKMVEPEEKPTKHIGFMMEKEY